MKPNHNLTFSGVCLVDLFVLSCNSEDLPEPQPDYTTIEDIRTETYPVDFRPALVGTYMDTLTEIDINPMVGHDTTITMDYVVTVLAIRHANFVEFIATEFSRTVDIDSTRIFATGEYATSPHDITDVFSGEFSGSVLTISYYRDGMEIAPWSSTKSFNGVKLP